MPRHLLLFDSHCHIRRRPLVHEATASGSVLREETSDDMDTSCGLLRGALLCGTHPSVDWELIRAVAKRGCSSSQSFSALTAFGVHPWFSPPPPLGPSALRRPSVPLADDGSGGLRPSLDAVVIDSISPEATATASSPEACCGCSCASVLSEATAQQNANCSSSSSSATKTHPMTLESLMSELEQALLEFPLAWVGEIGLDKIRGEQSTQPALFHAQMCLAAKYRRPVSVHCVRSFGLMLDVLRAAKPSELPPVIILHGYSGSLDFAASLAKIPNVKSGKTRIYFGIGSNTTARLKTFQSLLLALPQDRLLLESDEHYQVSVANESDDSAGISCRESDELSSRVSGAKLLPELSSWADVFLDALPLQALHENFSKLLSELRLQA